MERLFWMMPKAIATVMLLWYFVSLFFVGDEIVDAGIRLLQAILTILVAFFGGVLFWKIFSVKIYKEHLMRTLETSKIKEVQLNLYTSNDKNKNRILHPRIPLAQDFLPKSEINEKLLSNWGGFCSYKKKYPNHARVFEAILQVLSHYDYLPATHHAQGHGGHSLIEHSLNVVRLMDKLSKSYRYYGYYQNDKLIRPLLEPSSLEKGFYSFNQDEPLLPIIALAHDLGKVQAFKPTSSKSLVSKLKRYFSLRKKTELVQVERVHGAHDLLGKKLLQKIPEIYQLTWEERNDLLNAVGYHHHYEGEKKIEDFFIQGLPYSNLTSDRQHALAALMEYVDTQTSYLEGGKKIKPFYIPLALRGNKSVSEDAQKGVSTDNVDILEDEINDVDAAPESPGIDTQQNNDDEGEVFKWLCQLIKEEGKSKKGNGRLNKDGGFVYLNELYWRNWLFKKSKPVPAPEKLTLAEPATLHPTTIELLKILEDKKAIPLSEDVDSSQPLLFTVSTDRTNGTPYIRERVIVFRESAIPFTVGFRKSNQPISIVAQFGIVSKPESTMDSQPVSQTKPSEINSQPIGSFAEPQASHSQPTMSQASTKPQPEPVVHSDAKINAQKDNIGAFIEWVTLVQNLEFPNEDPFPEKKEKGRTYALINILAIPKRFIEEGPLIGVDDRVILNAEEQYVRVEIELRKRMRN